MFEPSTPTKKTDIVFGAHPDDIEIGMVGTICRLTDSGNEDYPGLLHRHFMASQLDDVTAAMAKWLTECQCRSSPTSFCNSLAATAT